MDQKISIKIADRIFNLTAASPEAEELYRQAADAINNRFAAFTRSHPGRTANDLLSLVALNETVVRLKLQKELERSATEEKELAADLERYLKDLEK
jgi:cell division protein ZapA (FtsZ GTPase activity inhibitor)